MERSTPVVFIFSLKSEMWVTFDKRALPLTTSFVFSTIASHLCQGKICRYCGNRK